MGLSPVRITYFHWLKRTHHQDRFREKWDRRVAVSCANQSVEWAFNSVFSITTVLVSLLVNTWFLLVDRVISKVTAADYFQLIHTLSSLLSTKNSNNHDEKDLALATCRSSLDALPSCLHRCVPESSVHVQGKSVIFSRLKKSTSDRLVWQSWRLCLHSQFVPSKQNTHAVISHSKIVWACSVTADDWCN